MSNSISGNGGIDTSSLNQLLVELQSILSTQKEINSTSIKPKADDSNIIPIRKSLETIREEVEKTSVSDVKLFNTKTIQRSISEAENALARIRKSTNDFKEDMTGIDVAKAFIRNYTILDEYGKKFGKDYVSNYKKIFKQVSEELLGYENQFKGNISGLSKNQLDEMFVKEKSKFDREISSAVSEVNMNLTYAKEDYYKNLAAEKKAAYDQERQAAIEAAEAVKQAELEKQNALVTTRDEFLQSLQSQLEAMNNMASKGQALQVDYDQWGRFQKSAGDMMRVLQEMGVEVVKFEDLMASISKQVYIPKDQMVSFGASNIDSSALEKANQEIETLRNSVAELQNQLYNSVDYSTYDELNSSLDKAEEKIKVLENALITLKSNSKVTVDSSEIDKVKQEITEVENVLNNTKGSPNRTVPYSTYSNLLEDLSKAKTEVESLSTALSNLESQGKSSVSFGEYKQLVSDLERAEHKIESLNGVIKIFISENNELQQTIYSNSSIYAEKDTKIDELEQKLLKLKETISSLSADKEALTNENAELQQLKSNVSEASDGIKNGFDTESLNQFLDVLKRIEEQLKSITTTLGTIDESSGVKNLIQSVDTLFTKLDNIRTKIGTGIYNVEINSGNNYGSPQDQYIDKTLKDLRARYEKVVSAFGDEEKLFQRFGADQDTKLNLFGKDTLNSLSNPREQIDRIRGFFEEFRNLREQIRSDIELAKSDLNEMENKLDDSGKKIINARKIRSKINNVDENGILKEKLTADEQYWNMRYEAMKEEERLLQRLDKISAPSKTNARMDSKLKELRESEIEEQKKIQELSKVDLSGVIDSLTKIENLLAEISKKDLLSNSINTVGEKLDGITEKFQVIADLIKDINNTPVGTKAGGNISNQTPVSSSADEVNRATEAIQQEGEAAEKAAQQKNEFVVANENVAKSGIATANGIKEATEAIRQEGQVVSESKINISDFERMIEVSDDLKTQLGGVLDVYQQIRKGADGGTNIAYRLVGENGYAWVGQNGDLLKQNIQTSDELTRQRETEKAQQVEINNALKEREKAYNAILQTRREIAKLDVEKNPEKIASLQKEKKDRLETYRIKTNELKALDKSAYREQTINTILEAQKKNRQEIAKIMAGKTDSVNNQSAQSNITAQAQYNALIAKVTEYNSKAENEIVKGNQSDADSYKRLADAAMQAAERIANGHEIDRQAAEQSLKVIEAQEKAIREKSKTEQQVSKQQEKNNLRQSDMLNKFTTWVRNNSAVSKKFGTDIEQIFRSLREGTNHTTQDLNDIQKKINEVKTAAAKAGSLGKSVADMLKGRLKSLMSYLTIYTSFYSIVRYVRNAVTTVKELDSALLDLAKTTTMNSYELNKFYMTSTDIAKQMGVTTQEIITQAAAWSRLGYSSKKEAEEMAKVSSMFASISPGMTTDVAQQGLVSMMKAYKIDVENVTSEILDNVNTLGNKFALSNEDIVQGMERAGAALSAVGTSFKDSLALFTGGQEILQNSEKMGTALRSISMRIRSYNEESEEYDEELKTITGDLIDLTKTAQHANGVSIFKEGSTTEFKSLVDYLREISQIWDEMTDKQKNDYLQKAFAKTQAQAGASIIQNFDQVEKALEAMESSAGSATREMGLVEQTIEYKMNALKETWTDTLKQLLSREELGNIVDLFTTISEYLGGFITKVGVLGSVMTGFGLAAIIKNIGRSKMHLLMIKCQLQSVFFGIPEFSDCRLCNTQV